MNASGTKAKPPPAIEVVVEVGTEPVSADWAGTIADFLLSLGEDDVEANGRGQREATPA